MQIELQSILVVNHKSLDWWTMDFAQTYLIQYQRTTTSRSAQWKKYEIPKRRKVNSVVSFYLNFAQRYDCSLYFLIVVYHLYDGETKCDSKRLVGILYGSVRSVAVDFLIVIQPGSCTNTLNVGSRGGCIYKLNEQTNKQTNDKVAKQFIRG